MRFSQRFQMVLKTFFIEVMVVFFCLMVSTSFSCCKSTASKTKWQERLKIRSLIVFNMWHIITPFPNIKKRKNLNLTNQNPTKRTATDFDLKKKESFTSNQPYLLKCDIAATNHQLYVCSKSWAQITEQWVNDDLVSLLIQTGLNNQFHFH